MLINNAGIDVFDRFEKIDPKYIKNMININCVALYLLNRQFAKQLNSRTSKSAIINVSSGVVEIPLAYYSTYNGTKALVDSFTLSVADEYKNIDFMSMKPYDVSTNMINNRPTDIMTITRTECVQGFLNCLGHEVQSVGHWKHRLQDYVYSLIPRSVQNLIYFKFVAKDFFAERKYLIPSYRGLPADTQVELGPEEFHPENSKKTN
jgi:short-subunit dehydrogenase